MHHILFDNDRQCSTTLRERLQAVFFDFDDALVQSLDIKAAAFMSLFDDQEAGIRQDIHNHFLQYTGRSRQAKLQHIYGEILRQPLANDELERLCEIFTKRSHHAVITAPEVPGADWLLQRLLQRNITMFVVSGTPETELQQIVEERGMAHYFREVRGTPVEKEINIAQLIERHGLEPARCLMVGDGRVDHIAAEHNGLHFVGVVKSDNPFPASVPVVPDLMPLAHLLE